MVTKKKKAVAKKRPAKKKKKTAAKKKTVSKGGRPGTDPALIEIGIAEVRAGRSVAAAAKTAGISARVLYRALEKTDAKPTPDDDDFPELPDLDENASPLDNARALFEHQRQMIAKLPKDSPRMNPAHNNVRSYIKLIASLEREHVGEETPEQRTERLRREDGATRKKIEQYVLQYEKQAQRDGVCLHCGQALTEGAHVDHRAQALRDVLPTLKAVAVLADPEGRQMAVAQGALALAQIAQTMNEWPDDIRKMVVSS